MKHRLRKILRSDRADAVLVTTIIGIMMLVVVAGFAASSAKSVLLRDVFISQSQSAAQSAVRTMDARGSLTVDSIRQFHNSLMQQKQDDTEASVWQSDACSFQEDENFPNYELQLVAENSYDNEPGTPEYAATSGTFTFSAQPDESPEAQSQRFEQELQRFLVEGGLDARDEYKVITANVRNASDNILLGMIGMPCQAYEANVTAGTFNEFE